MLDCPLEVQMSLKRFQMKIFKIFVCVVSGSSIFYSLERLEVTLNDANDQVA